MEMKDKVIQIAQLAHLEFSEAEIDGFSEQFSKIVDYIGVIEELDLANVEPMTHAVDTVNVFREDEAKESLSLEEALLNAPKRNEYFFKVPKVIE